jgi:hypothetical protein
MMGDDIEYQRVIEEDARLDAEMNRLAAKRLELQRQLDEVSVVRRPFHYVLMNSIVVMIEI